jgi:hypothetical protein
MKKKWNPADNFRNTRQVPCCEVHRPQERSHHDSAAAEARCLSPRMKRPGDYVDYDVGAVLGRNIKRELIDIVNYEVHTKTIQVLRITRGKRIQKQDQKAQQEKAQQEKAQQEKAQQDLVFDHEESITG